MQKIIRLPQDTLLTYLPGTLVDSWARHPRQAPIWGHWLSGSLMHCDISGFTAMSESLAKLGKEGAELMAGVLNRFFDRMLEVADRWGGVQMKFGGDAMLLFFSGQDNAASAVACGLEMQKEMTKFRRIAAGGQEHRLHMRAGIHNGRFFAASVGNLDGTLHYLLLGPDVNRTAAVEPIAGPDQVVVSAEAAALLGPQHHLAGTAQRGVWRVRSAETPPIPLGNPAPPRAPVDVLQRYLMPPLAEGRVTTVSGEHRRVTAMFINVLGVSSLLQTEGDGQALAEIDAYVKTLIDVLERNGGFLAASDVAEDGDKLIALFGAPVSHEHEEAAAVRSAWEVQAELQNSDLNLTQRIGINSGFVFAGEIGSRRRREYTVIGDSVNLAARLMAAARPGQVLVSADTAARAGHEFHLRRMRPIRVKGKSQPVRLWRLEGARAAVAEMPETQPDSPIVGRAREVASLLRLSRQAAAGSTRWAFVYGDPGIGKSRLVAELAARLRAQGWTRLAAQCQAHTSGTPFSAWLEPLRSLFGIETSDTPDDALKRITEAVERIRPDLLSFAPLVGELLSLPVAETPVLRSLDAKARRERLTTVIREVLHAAALAGQHVIVFEDAHWADGPSLELLGEVLTRQDTPLMVYVTSRREAPPAEMAATPPQVSLQLSELGVEDARRLVDTTAHLSDDELEALMSRAQGNPLFLQELARSASVHRGVLPETINDVIMARLDALPGEERTALRLASVIGPTFSPNALRSLSAGYLEPSSLDRLLERLERRGFTRALGDDASSHTFSHALVRETAYETLPYAQRRKLHRAVAAEIEMERAGNLKSVSELLLHHYELSGDTAKTVHFAALSGDRAGSMFACRQAAEYYRRSLAALDGTRRRVSADRTLLLERLGDTLETEGRYAEAGEAFVQALREWRRAGKRARPRFVPWRPRTATREALLCRKVAVSFERRSDYAESLRWLDTALAALPRRAGTAAPQVYAAKSMALFRKGLYSEAIRWGRIALQMSRRSEDPHEIAYAHRVLANSYIEEGALRQAIRHLRLAVRIYHELGDLTGQAMANSNLAACYQLLGIMDGALYHLEVGLQADLRVGNVTHAAIVHNNIGEVLLVMGRLDEALSRLEAVVGSDLAGTDLAAVAGLADVNLSRCHLALNNLDAADRYVRRGLRLLRRVGAEGLLTEAHLQLAELRLAQGRPAAARRGCQRCLNRARALSARLLEARGERVLAGAEAALGNPERALAHARLSVALARRIGADYEEARALVLQARLLRDGARTRSGVRKALQRAITILSRVGAKPELAEAKEMLATID